MKNLKIGKKLSITFGIIILMFCVTVLIAILSLNKTEKNLQSIRNGNQVTSKAIEMRKVIQSGMKNISYSILTDDAIKTQEYIAAANNDLDSLRDGLTFMKQYFGGDMNLVAQAEEYLEKGKPFRTEVLQLALDNKKSEANTLFFNTYQPILKNVEKLFSEIDSSSTQNANHIYTTSQKTEKLSILFLFLISGFAFIATVILADYITRGLKKPILEIEQAAIDMSQGNLDVTVTYTSKDELGNLSDKIRILTKSLKNIIQDQDYLLGQMALGNFEIQTNIEKEYRGNFKTVLQSMQKIRNNLNNILTQINESADQAADSSEQVSYSAQALSQGATEQASAIEELAVSINDISTQVNHNAQNAMQMNEKANAVGTEVIESNQRMQNMVTAMSEINISSKEIRKIIKTIEDIAFQTNILALNAAIEAAKAGTSGKGFAVVADEVRNLASKSSEASKSTAALIENSLKSIANGSKIVNETAKSLSAVVKGIQEVTTVINEISTASKAQSESITQITQGIDQIASVVQTNSATAEESAAASEELSSQAQLLKNLVSKFHLKDNNKFIPETVSQPQKHTPSKTNNIKY